MPRIRLLYLLHGFAVAAFGPFASVILADRGFEPAAIGLVYAITSLTYIFRSPRGATWATSSSGGRGSLQVAMLGAAAMLLVFAFPLTLPLLAVATWGMRRAMAPPARCPTRSR